MAEYQDQLDAGTAVLLEAKDLEGPPEETKGKTKKGKKMDLPGTVTTVLVSFDAGLEQLEAKKLPMVPGGELGRRVHSTAWREAVFGNLARDRAVVLIGNKVPCLLDVFDPVFKAL